MADTAQESPGNEAAAEDRLVPSEGNGAGPGAVDVSSNSPKLIEATFFSSYCLALNTTYNLCFFNEDVTMSRVLFFIFIKTYLSWCGDFFLFNHVFRHDIFFR